MNDKTPPDPYAPGRYREPSDVDEGAAARAELRASLRKLNPRTLVLARQGQWITVMTVEELLDDLEIADQVAPILRAARTQLEDLIGGEGDTDRG